MTPAPAPATTSTRRVSDVGRRASMVALALPLLYMVLVVSSVIAGLLAMSVLFVSGKFYSPNLLWELVLAAMLASVAGVYAAVPPSRFMLRVFPLHADGRRRWLLMVGVALLAVMTAAMTLWVMLHPNVRIDYAPGPQSRLTGLAVVLVQACILIWLLYRRDAGIDGHRVLYLRRFRSASDRVVYRELLAALPAGSTLTALVPLSGGARDLDPYTIAVAGLRWRDPLASIPRAFDSDDTTWQSHVRRMLLAADCVVVDGSAPSDAMTVEYRLIEELGLGAKTIVLAAKDAPGPPQFSAATLLRYELSGWPSLARPLGVMVLAGLYGWLAYAWPGEYLALGLLCFLPMLPGALQRPVKRTSLRALSSEISRRLPARPRSKVAARWLASTGLVLTPACVILLAAIGARWLYPISTASDPAALRALTDAMSEQEVRVGEQTIKIPVAAGFVDPKDTITGVRRVLADDTSTHAHPLLTLVPIGWVVQRLFDDQVPSDAGMTLTVSRDYERDIFDEEAFAELRKDLRARLTGAERSGMPQFELIDEAQRFVTLGFQAPAAQGLAGPAVPVRKTCAMTLILLMGKPLTMVTCRYLHSADDAPWVRRLAARWVTQSLASNPALPPLDRSGFGFKASSVVSVSLSPAEAFQRQGSLTITEVMPGSTAAQAGLRPGDQVLTVDGATVSGQPGRLAEVLHGLPPGGSTRLRLLRDGNESEVVLTRPKSSSKER